MAFTGTVGYTLTTGPNTIHVEAWDQAFHMLPPTGTPGSASVSGGSGEVTLSHSVAVPATGVSRLSVIFYLGGGNRVISVAIATFPVQ